ncbi:MAG: hypothetical protein NC203_10720 [Firmicutes bacterium]|nr:hypothetical protein [[Eubacterium] siraeum]MCM1488826.1 hypothetical protein [Bacillota bacterium]
MKRKIVPLLLILALILTACSSQPAEPETDGVQTTTLAAAATATAATSAAVTTATVQATAEETTTTTDAATSAKTAVCSYQYDLPYMEYPDESLIAQYEEFNFEQNQGCDKWAEEAAIAAYKASDLYTEALEETKKLLRYENGELSEIETTWKTYYGELQDFVDEAAAPEIDIKPVILEKIKAKLDGKTEEHLFIFMTAMPDSCLISTAEKTRILFGVYVNSDGQAFILYNSLYQGHLYYTAQKYINSGKIHAVFNGAHSDETALTAVYSFENGQPKTELFGHGSFFPDNGKIWEWAHTFNFSTSVFYNAEEEEYYEIEIPNEDFE